MKTQSIVKDYAELEKALKKVRGPSAGEVFLTLVGALTIALVGLKLLGDLSWSWVGVFCPIWAPLILITVVFLFGAFRDVGSALYKFIFHRI